MPIISTGNEDTVIDVNGIQIVESAPGTVTFTLTATHGVLNVAPGAPGGLDGSGGSINGNGTDTLILRGNAAQINATLDNLNGLQFTPAADFNGTGVLTYNVTDGLDNSSETFDIAVSAVNDAPVATGSATLTAVNEGAAAPAGQTVTALFGSHFSDVDGDGLAGVALTDNAASSQGIWQYFNGAWVTIGSPSESTALVLAAGTLVRFLPAANFNGAVPALTAYLIDNSGGAVTTGTLLDVSANGGQTRFSDTSLTLSTTITAVNDTPSVPATATTVGATEQTAATLLGSVTVSDVDLDALNSGNGDYAGASFTVQRTSPNANDIFGFSGGAFTVSGGNLQVGGLTFATFTSTGGVLMISFTSSATSATNSLVNDVINHIRYTNSSDAPPSSVTLDYALNDGAPGAGQGSGGASTASGSVIVNITAVNDPHTGGASVTGTAAEDSVLTAVSTLADPDGLGTLHYQWQHDVGGGYVNVGADQTTYTLGDGDIGGVVRVVIYYTDAGGTVESATSAATAAIAATNDAPTGGVSLTGTATEDQVLTADTSTLADTDGLGTLHYDWQRNTGSGFASTGAADQATYTLADADVGGVLRVVVSYTDGQGFANIVTSAGTSAIAAVNDAHTGGASITGTATEDEVLTAVSTLADVDGLGTLHYDWQRDTGSGYVSTGAADQATYTLGDADVGGVIRVIISYTDGQGFAESATSAGTSAIANVNDAPTGGVSITGTVTENQVLTADTSTLADADGLGTLHYQWQRDTGIGFANVGTDQATYTLGDADVGGVIRVVAAYVDQQGAAESVTSADTAAVAGVNDAHTGGASITGTATEDEVLTAVSTLADVDGLGTLHYDWQRDTGSGYVSTGAADQATYTLGDADVGGVIRVDISYTDGQGFAESATSAGTAVIANVNDAPTGGVSISGTVTEGQVLTADTSTLADDDGLGTLHYQWQRDTGGGYVDIGTDQATYTLASGDIGGVVRVVTSYTDQHGAAESVTSADTASVAALNDAPTGGVSISGTATEDQVLTADTSTLVDDDGLGTLHYQWQRDVGSGYVNVGADQSTYTLGDVDVGGVVRVVVSYTDGQGFAESVTSPDTAAIANVNDAPTGGVSISGTTTEDQILTADTSALTDDDGLGTLHYQWQRDTGAGYVDVGVDQATYTLGDSDVGGVVRVVVSYVDQQGAAEAVTSADSAAIANVNDLPTGAVTITGTETQGQTLTADISTLADDDGLGTISYQWQADGVDIGGATASTLLLGQAQVGKAITVAASYTDDQGTAESVASAATGAVANVNDAPTGALSIGGSANVGQTLTVSSTVADLDGLGTFSYQWQADGVDIGGATTASLVLASGQLGKVITVTASYTDLLGTAESVTSAATGTVADVVVVPPTTTPPVVTTVDGVSVQTTTSVNPTTGLLTQTITVPVITGDRQDDGGSSHANLADIPLGLAGGANLTVSLPTGTGVTASGPTTLLNNADALRDLIARIEQKASGSQSAMNGAATAFLATQPSGTTSQILGLNLTGGTSSTIEINATPTTGKAIGLVIDASQLPDNAVLVLNNVDFAAVIGAATLRGGEGKNYVIGDDAAQNILLGPDDDELHGGGGDDIVGSAGGNDKIYGDAGNDILFGGEGDDLLDGGTGFDTALMAGVRSNYHFTHSASGLMVSGFEGDDTIVSIEMLKFADGAEVTNLKALVADTTSVAVLTYQFFTGKTPTGAGLEYLLHAPDTVNARDLTDAYYQKFNIENRYINFTVNLASPAGEGGDFFNRVYGSLTMDQTVTKAYAEIFGTAITQAKVDLILDADVGGGMTREGYFLAVSGSQAGAKAAVIGWLMAEAVKADVGRYALANDAFLDDFSDGSAQLNVDLVAVYGDGHAWSPIG